MGASGGGFQTTIVFDSDTEVDVEQASASAILGYQASTRLGLVASAGAILGGSVDYGAEGDVGKGIMLSVSTTYLALYENATRPFVLLSLTIGHSRASAVSDDNLRHDWTATDLRPGLMVGKTFAERVVPFGAARVFAGPVQWRLGGQETTGGDQHHYALGGGASYRVPGTLDMFMEVLALGEKSASLGASFSF